MDLDQQLRQLQEELNYERRAREPSTFRRQPPVAVFWDYENCSPPLSTNPSSLVKHFRALFQPYGPISFIRCYQDVGAQPVFAQNLRSGLEACAVEVRDCGRWGRKDVADHHIMTDIFMYALDNPAPATIVLISGDKDFSYLLANLCNRNYNVILVENQIGAAEELKSSASKVFKWREILRDAAAAKDSNSSTTPTATTTFREEPRVSLSATPHRSRSNSDPNLSPSVVPTALVLPKEIESRPVLKHAFSSSSLKSTQNTGPFGPLLDVLKGRSFEHPPLRSAIQPLVLKKDVNAFVKAGTASWREYVEKAEAAGLVVLGIGPKPGMETIKLAKPLSTLTLSSLPTEVFNQSSNPIIPNALSKFSTSTSISQSTIPSIPPAPLPDSYSSTPISSARKRVLTNTLAKSSITTIRDTYQPLINILSCLPSSPPPQRYIVSQLLKATPEGAALVENYGWKPYIEQAEHYGFVRMGGSTEDLLGRWIQLVPSFRVDPPPQFEKKTPVPPFAVHTAELFRPLLIALNSLPAPSSSNKAPAALISRVAGQLKDQEKKTFGDVGVGNIGDYLQVAKWMGVVRLGMLPGDGGGDWVALRKGYRGLEGYGVPAPRAEGKTEGMKVDLAREVSQPQPSPIKVVKGDDDVNALFAGLKVSSTPSKLSSSPSASTSTPAFRSPAVPLPAVKETTRLFDYIASPDFPKRKEDRDPPVVDESKKVEVKSNAGWESSGGEEDQGSSGLEQSSTSSSSSKHKRSRSTPALPSTSPSPSPPLSSAPSDVFNPGSALPETRERFTFSIPFTAPSPLRPSPEEFSSLASPVESSSRHQTTVAHSPSVFGSTTFDFKVPGGGVSE